MKKQLKCELSVLDLHKPKCDKWLKAFSKKDFIIKVIPENLKFLQVPQKKLEFCQEKSTSLQLYAISLQLQNLSTHGFMNWSQSSFIFRTVAQSSHWLEQLWAYMQDIHTQAEHRSEARKVKSDKVVQKFFWFLENRLNRFKSSKIHPLQSIG